MLGHCFDIFLERPSKRDFCSAFCRCRDPSGIAFGVHFAIFSGTQKREPGGISFRRYLVPRWRLGGVQGSLREDLDYRISEGGLLRLRQSWRDWRGGSNNADAQPRHRAHQRIEVIKFRLRRWPRNLLCPPMLHNIY